MPDAPTISIVDDDASVRGAIARFLRSIGYSTRVFASAKEFLSSRFGESSCIIADVQMPDMSGIELQEHLLAEGHKIPLIFITAFPGDQVRDRALKAGAICFLSKPFDENHFIECLQLALGPPDPESPEGSDPAGAV
jgi:FixJ family two-component response regulator